MRPLTASIANSGLKPAYLMYTVPDWREIINFHSDPQTAAWGQLDDSGVP